MALQGQFAASIRKYCNSSITIRAWRCGDSTVTCGETEQKHLSLFNHYSWYGEFYIPSCQQSSSWDSNHSFSQLENPLVVQRAPKRQSPAAQSLVHVEGCGPVYAQLRISGTQFAFPLSSWPALSPGQSQHGWSWLLPCLALARCPPCSTGS